MSSPPFISSPSPLHTFSQVKHTLTELLGLDFSGDVPLAIVDSQEMRRVSLAPPPEISPDLNSPPTCFLKVKSGATKGNSSSPSLGLTVKALLKESQYFKPQKILILKGMSRLTTGSVMAHEVEAIEFVRVMFFGMNNLSYLLI